MTLSTLPDDRDAVTDWVCECPDGTSHKLYLTLNEYLEARDWAGDSGFVRSLSCSYLDENEVEIQRTDKYWIARPKAMR